MPSNKHWSNEIKKKLADSAKKCKSVKAFFRYTIISCYNFDTMGSIQGSGGIYRFKNSKKNHHSALKMQEK